MASLAKGITLSWGLISATVRVESAVSKAETKSMTTLCVGGQAEHPAAHAPSPITSPYMCGTCKPGGAVTDKSLLKKGIETDTGYAVVDTAAVVEAKASTDGLFKKSIALVPSAVTEVANTSSQGDKLYQLVPEPGDGRYAILARLIQSHPELAFTALYTVRTRATQYVARVRNGVILIEERIPAERLNALPQVDGVINEPMYTMAEGMLPMTVVPYDPATYETGYTAALAALAAAATEVVQLDTNLATVTPLHKTDDELMAALAALAAPAKKPAPKKRVKAVPAPEEEVA